MRAHQAAPLMLVQALSLALCTVSMPVLSADYTWAGGGGDWDITTNWDPTGVPQSYGDTASILSDDEIDWYISYSTPSSAYLDVLTLDATADGKVMLQLWGSHLHAEEFLVGASGRARVVQSGADVFAWDLAIGRHAGSEGAYQLDAGYLHVDALRLGESLGAQGGFTFNGGGLAANRVYVGQGGAGSFIMDIAGGSWNLMAHQQIVIGLEVGSEGVFEHRNGDIGRYWSPDDNVPLIIGAAGQGTYRQDEGRHFADKVLIGHLAGGVGRYELMGEHAQLHSQRMVVGDAGAGHFFQAAGTHFADDLVVGRTAGSDGEYQLADGHLSVWSMRLGESAGSEGRFIWTGGRLDGGDVHVGQGGAGSFIMEIAGDRWYLTPYQQLVIGVEAGSTGLFEQRSGDIDASYWSSDDYAPLIVGAAGEGSYRHIGGSTQVREVLVGHLAGGSGAYVLAEDVEGWGVPAVLSVENLVVGDAGVGDFQHQAGTVGTQVLKIGRQADSEGRYELAGGQWFSTLQSESTVVGDAGSGRFVQTGGSHFSAELVIGHEAGSVGVYELSGGNLTTLTTHIGAKEGATGTMRVSGPDAGWYNDGTVQVGTDLFGLPPSGMALLELRDGARIYAEAVIIGESGEVQGDGRIHADVFNQGLLTPGMGALEIFGDYSQTGEGTLFVEIGGHGIGQDFLDVWGTAVLGGSLWVGLLDDYSIGLGDSFDILFASAVYGGFENLLFPVFNGLTFDISYEYGSVRLTAVSAVPVPAALWLLGSGLLLLLGMARNRQAG